MSPPPMGFVGRVERSATRHPLCGITAGYASLHPPYVKAGLPRMGIPFGFGL